MGSMRLNLPDGGLAEISEDTIKIRRCEYCRMLNFTKILGKCEWCGATLPVEMKLPDMCMGEIEVRSKCEAFEVPLIIQRE